MKLKYIIPLTENVVRIQLNNEKKKMLEELILVNKFPLPVFKVTESNDKRSQI